jgi:hypothetical protein
MFVEFEYKLGIGLHLYQVDEEIESIRVYETEDDEEGSEGFLVFSGIVILLPFCRIRIGESEVYTKE